MERTYVDLLARVLNVGVAEEVVADDRLAVSVGSHFEVAHVESVCFCSLEDCLDVDDVTYHCTI